MWGSGDNANDSPNSLEHLGFTKMILNTKKTRWLKQIKHFLNTLDIFWDSYIWIRRDSDVTDNQRRLKHVFQIFPVDFKYEEHAMVKVDQTFWSAQDLTKKASKYRNL